MHRSTRAHANHYSFSDAEALSNPNTDPNADTDSDLHADLYPHSDPHVYSHTQPNCYIHSAPAHGHSRADSGSFYSRSSTREGVWHLGRVLGWNR